MVKTIVAKRASATKEPEGVYRLTFELGIEGSPNAGGCGTFWVDLDFSQIYVRSMEIAKPIVDTEEAVAAFLEKCVDETDLYEVLTELELLETAIPLSLTVEKRS